MICRVSRWSVFIYDVGGKTLTSYSYTAEEVGKDIRVDAFSRRIDFFSAL